MIIILNFRVDYFFSYEYYICINVYSCGIHFDLLNIYIIILKYEITKLI